MESEEKFFKVTFSSFDSNVSDPPNDDLGEYNGKEFSTYDNDRDSMGNVNCAVKCRAGFWYNNCDTDRGTINQPRTACGGFTWDKDQIIQLTETKLYLECVNDD